jgi:hypothetical protein
VSFDKPILRKDVIKWNHPFNNYRDNHPLNKVYDVDVYFGVEGNRIGYFGDEIEITLEEAWDDQLEPFFICYCVQIENAEFVPTFDTDLEAANKYYDNLLAALRYDPRKETNATQEG